MEQNKIYNLVIEVIEELNDQLDKEKKIIPEANTVLIGKSGGLDSLGVVNFMVMLEQKIENELNVQLNLPYELVIGKNSPLHTIKSTSDYIFYQIKSSV
jgi:acyl carrier protein